VKMREKEGWIVGWDSSAKLENIIWCSVEEGS
jgi:hypothetical protein